MLAVVAKITIEQVFLSSSLAQTPKLPKLTDPCSCCSRSMTSGLVLLFSYSGNPGEEWGEGNWRRKELPQPRETATAREKADEAQNHEVQASLW